VDKEPIIEEPEAQPHSRRLAIFDQDGDGKGMVARLTINEGKEISAEALLEANPDSIAKLRSVLGQLDQSQRQDIAAITAVLQRAGFTVTHLPDADYSLNLQLDFDTGQMLATQDPLHGLAQENAPLGRSIFEAIAKRFKQVGTDLAGEIESFLAKDDLSGSAAVLKQSQEAGSFMLSIGPELLAVLVKIDVAKLSDDDRRIVRHSRLAVAHRLHRYDIAAVDAEAVLTTEGATLKPDEAADLKMILGLDALKRGNKETALSIWRGLLAEPSPLSNERRGWAWRNISLALESTDPEAARAAKHSADAFLQAGKKDDAAKSLKRVVDILLHAEPSKALHVLDEVLSLLEREGLRDRHLLAAVHHTRANHLAQLGRHKEALADAFAAASLLRGLFGAESHFASSLYLASVEANALGNVDDAAAYKAEADKLVNDLSITQFQLAERLSKLFQSYDQETAEALVREAMDRGLPDIVAGVRIAHSMLAPGLSDAARLDSLESGLRELESSGKRVALREVVRLALGRQLRAMHRPERAALQFEKALESDPLNAEARDNLLDCLWELERWEDAAALLEVEIKRRGELPGLLFAYGKSLFSSGDISGAIPPLTKAGKLALDEGLKEAAETLRERALDLGGTVYSAQPAKEEFGPVTREELEKALSRFVDFIGADKRMGFWRRTDGKRVWTERPERRGQDLLHAFLKATFRERIQIFEELDTGAGRLDLYVQLAGGLSVILELKMCGYGYSSAYAAAGEPQITHYMTHRKTRLGYLVVFDARRDFAAPLLPDEKDGATIKVIFIDVRPTVKPDDESS
jgi:tetratricopeptide (TPR) repeat protein